MVQQPQYQGCVHFPNELVKEGIRLFNERNFFQCHEVLEEAWLAEQLPIRNLYKGILQIGVGCLHFERNNYRGSVAKLESGLHYIFEFAPVCQTIQIAQLITDTQRLLAIIEQSGPDHFQEIDRMLFPTIEYSMP